MGAECRGLIIEMLGLKEMLGFQVSNNKYGGAGGRI